MSERLRTPEQEAAILLSGNDVLVEAGAGSGKTGVMVERYCRLVCVEGVAPEAILAITFTDKAAAELRQRIRAELARRAEAGSQAARRHLAGIGGAWVTTIHGFCNRLLAGHPVAAGIDPQFRVLDAAEVERVGREAFEEALEEFLATGEESREECVAALEIDGLRAIIAATFSELRSRGLEPRLPEPPSPEIGPAIRRAAGAAAGALEDLGRDDPRRATLERALSVLGPNGGPAPGPDQLTALRIDSAARALSSYREALELAISRSAEAGEGGLCYRNIATLLELFSARFAAAKESRAAVDFEDLQILATKLLGREEIGASYRSRFSHLMVDEFQDTNRLQLRLIEALRGPGSELMSVGDELQSIYGFRHADLEVFREQRRAFAKRPDAATIELSGNFRSSPAVIAAVNALGAVLFGDSYRELRVGAAPAQPLGRAERPAVELLLSARDGWEGLDLSAETDGRTPLNCIAEARFLARALRELTDAGVAREEIVVLLRAFTHLDAYEDSLERAGLRPYVVGGRGYWSQQQVADVCALLAAIANPLDDQAIFGALASPACGVAPDTLWLLRAAAGRGRHVWPALERAAGLGEAELAAAERLDQIPAAELALLHRFAQTLAALRERSPRLSLAALIDAAVRQSGYDLAVLGLPSGEARFANVRKLMRLASDFESREGRDLRGLLDFLAARAVSDSEALAATAAEGHDGVRIMTIHNAKGLEFGVVAVPDLSRSLLAGTRAPALVIGRDPEKPRIGMKLRRLGAPPINLYDYERLCAEARQRDAEEGLRLFHVAATRARERLILSGVVKPEPGREVVAGTPLIERIVAGLGIDRGADSRVILGAPKPRRGLEAEFQGGEIAVRVNLPSARSAAELAAPRRASATENEVAAGPAPLIERLPPVAARRPLSYTALSAYGDCPYRFYAERVLGLASVPAGGGPRRERAAAAEREQRAAAGAAVHSLLQWSQANGWREPPLGLARRHAAAQGLDPDSEGLGELLLPVRRWLGSGLWRERIGADPRGIRAEVPILLGIAGTILRGSIDLLIERPDSTPLVLDYKTDRLNGAEPAERAKDYEVQREIYALAVAESRASASVEVGYVFLEAPEDPVLIRLGPAELEAGRSRLAAAIERIVAGRFPTAAPGERSWAICGGCPALEGLCSGPPGSR